MKTSRKLALVATTALAGAALVAALVSSDGASSAATLDHVRPGSFSDAMRIGDDARDRLAAAGAGFPGDGDPVQVTMDRSR